MSNPRDLDGKSTAEVEAIARAALSALAQRDDVDAFGALLAMNAHLAECTAISAQQLSSSMSWTQIGNLAGTSRQNAWSRWSN